MKLDKRIPDDILRLTKSKPEQLLEWFENSCKKCEHPYWPCLMTDNNGNYINLYLDKYILFGHLEQSELIGSSVRIRATKEINLTTIWNYTKESKDNFNNIINQFKEMYNLKD